MDPLTIDPRKNGDQITSMFHYMLYDGLTRLAPNGAIELALAESYQILEEGCVYEFTLREAYWSNGDPILARDFELSWKRALDPHFSSPSPHLFFILRNGENARKGLCSFSQVGVEALSPRKLKITLECPCSHLLSLLSFCNFFPSHPILEKNLDWIDPSMIPTSGQFQISSWQKREVIRLRRNPFYWNQQNSFLEELEVYIRSDPEAAMHLFEEKRIDFLSTLFCSLHGESIKKYTRAGLSRFISFGASVFCSFNNSIFPFQNQNIRKAFSLAIDRKEIVQEMDFPFEIPAVRFLPPPLVKGKIEKKIEFDPIQARSCLQKGMKELGVSSCQETDQFKLRQFFQNLTLLFEYPRIETAQLLQKNWNTHLGLQVELEPSDYQSHLQKLYSGSYSMAIDHWVPQYMDPIAILERFKNKNILKNYPRFENQHYSTLLNQISKTGNLVQRHHLIEKAEQLLIEQAPLTPLYHHHHVMVAYPEAQDIFYLLNDAFGLMKCFSAPPLGEIAAQCS